MISLMNFAVCLLGVLAVIAGFGIHALRGLSDDLDRQALYDELRAAGLTDGEIKDLQ